MITSLWRVACIHKYSQQISSHCGHGESGSCMFIILLWLAYQFPSAALGSKIIICLIIHEWLIGAFDYFSLCDDWFYRYIRVNFTFGLPDCDRYIGNIVISSIESFLHTFTITFAGLSNVDRYTSNIVISSIVISRFHCIMCWFLLFPSFLDGLHGCFTQPQISTCWLGVGSKEWYIRT